MKTISIQEYHRQYPTSAPVPTLTQWGGFGALLAHRDERLRRRERRRALLGGAFRRAASVARAVIGTLRHGRTAVASPARARPAGAS